MESSEPSGSNISYFPQPKWAGIIGTLIAVLTLALPILAIAYYSSNSSSEILQSTTYVPDKTGR